MFRILHPQSGFVLITALVLLLPASFAADSDSTRAVTGLSPEQAIERAVNSITTTDNGVTLSHPRHQVDFNASGVSFRPRKGGPDWQWRLVQTARGGEITAAEPAAAFDNHGIIQFQRDAIIEQWVPRANAIEQQFILQSNPAGTGDFVVDGAVTTNGELEQHAQGWVWRSNAGVVSLGHVYVFDANGATIPAQMMVEAGRTRIIVDGSALDAAAYPVTIDPEVGTNDIRISAMDDDGDANFDAFNASIAYNSTDNEFLVVWHADQDNGSLINEELEIYGQRIDASDGSAVGNDDFRISDMGGDGNATFDAMNPAVTYNATHNEYLVVWEGRDIAANGFEIYGQRIFGDLSDGDETGNNDFRISDMGPDLSNSEDAAEADVVYNSTDDEYLVVWRGDDTDLGISLNEQEVFVQRIEGDKASGDEVGTNDIRVSDLGGTGNAAFNAFSPHVAFNSIDNEYLVVWVGDDSIGGLVDEDLEVFGQRLDASDASEVGNNDFRISDVGGTGTATNQAFFCDVAYNSLFNEYLVVWNADDSDAGLSDNEFEIFGQRIFGDLNDGDESGNSDFRISDLGGTANPAFDAGAPKVAYSAARNEYLVVWSGDDDTGTQVQDEIEILGQFIFGDSNDGDESGTNDFRLSDMGTDTDTAIGAFLPAVDYNSANDTFGIVWHGDDDDLGLADEEYEIFMQGFDPGNAPPLLTLPSGDLDYDENDPATALDTAATASDPDSADLNGGSLTVAYVGLSTANDQLSILTVGGITVAGASVSFGGDVIGTIDGTDNGVNGADLSIDFTTVDATPAALQALMRAIAFENISEMPNDLGRVASFTATDGDGGTSFIPLKNINITSINDDPTLTLPSAALDYDELDPATPIDLNGTLADVDSADFNGGSLSVSIATNGEAADQLGVQDSGTPGTGIEVAGATVSFDGNVIGTIDGTDNGVNGADLTIDFTTANATPAAAQALVRAITFANNSASPSTSPRTVAFTLTDGDTGSSGAINQTVNVNGTNDNPSISLPSAPATFVEGGGPVFIDSAAIVTDADNVDFDTATLTVDITVSNSDDDRLGINNEGNSAGQVGVSGSTVSFGGTPVGTFAGGAKAIAPLVVTFNASATQAAVQAVARNITFDNVSLNPSSATRTVQMTVTDGDGGTPAMATQNVNVNALPLPLNPGWLLIVVAVMGAFVVVRQNRGRAARRS